MDTKQLTKFLLASNTAGYVSGEEKLWVKNADGSTTIPFVQGAWKSHDNFYGGEPYGGRLVVFFREKPVWIMVYYGWVAAGANPDSVYQVLRKALKEMPEDAPLRGPGLLKDGLFTYHNEWDGDVERFFGHEHIVHDKKCAYEAHYMGGWVDVRSGI